MFASFAPASKLICGQLRGSTSLARTMNSYIPEIAKKYYTVAPVIWLKTIRKVFLSFLICLFLLQSFSSVCVEGSLLTCAKPNPESVNETPNDPSSIHSEVHQSLAQPSQENLTLVFQGGNQLMRLLSLSDIPSISRHLMCKNHTVVYDGGRVDYSPIEPTTTFRPSDTKAEFLTTVSLTQMKRSNGNGPTEMTHPRAG